MSLLILFLLTSPISLSAQSEFDFGDAPDPTYPTYLTNNGAYHAALSPTVILGTVIDAEPDGQPVPAGLGDDQNPPQQPDDEDGVWFPNTLIPGLPYAVTVTVSGATVIPSYLQGWIDFNGNGSWADPGEQVALDVPVGNTIHLVPFNVPPLTASGKTYARFRVSTNQSLPFTGFAPDGEVEDYELDIDPLKWLQPPNLTETGVDVDTDVELADDFLCNLSGPISDIHIWGSFFGDDEGVPLSVLTNMSFVFTIYSDIPASQSGTGYSMPGTALWSSPFGPGQYQTGLRIPVPQGEWWHNPNLLPPNDWIFPGDYNCYQFDFYPPAGEQFNQTNGVIYWLGLRVVNVPDGWKFGWKSTDLPNNWNDDAVWWDAFNMLWKDIRYGDGHPHAQLPYPENSLNLSFALSTPEEEEFDFGDAPDAVQGTGPGNPPDYETRLADNGAYHTIVSGAPYFDDPASPGSDQPDAEPDGQPDLSALGDDNDIIYGPPFNDDEDGIVFATLIAGQSSVVTITVAVGGYVNAWVDFNADGDWVDSGEQIHSAWLAAGSHNVPVNVPASATIGQTFARFRIHSATTALPPTGGPAQDGEVEDYEVFIEEEDPPAHDLGDAPSSFNNFTNWPMLAYPAAGVNAFYPTVLLLPPPMSPYGPIHMQPLAVAFLGTNVTLEVNADIGPDADGVNNIVPLVPANDQDKADDGLLLPLTLSHCRSTSLGYTVTWMSGITQMHANVWFDWNRDGDWNDTLTCPDGTTVQEWAVQNQFLAAPAGPFPVQIATNTPGFTSWQPTLTNDPIWMRISLAEQPWIAPGFSGAGGDGPMNGYSYGETEDYYLTDYETVQEFDFGDAPASYPTLLPGGARHYFISGYNLGTNIDWEADGLPNVSATGDDTNNVADEDGVTFTTSTNLVRGSNACVAVYVTSGIPNNYLDAWVDFNGNKTWETPAEQVFTSQLLSAGNNPGLCFLVPTNAVLGTNYARFRLSSLGGVSPGGQVNNGEVEDYRVNICQRQLATNVIITNVVVSTASVTNQAIALQWNSEVGITYQMQQAMTLSNSPVGWSNVGPAIHGPANKLVLTNANSVFERYYRVWVPYVCP